MKAIAHGNNYILRFDKDENFLPLLEEWAGKNNITGAFFYGLGGAQEARLGYYDLLGDSEYHFQTFQGMLEITNITGNIGVKDDSTAIHAHATIALENGKALGGHVKAIIVGGTLEIFVQTTDRIHRQINEDTGLAQIS